MKSMLNDHFMIISIKNYSSLVKLNISKTDFTNDGNNSSEISLNLGDSIKTSFIDNDLLLIESNNLEIRIDVDIDSIEKTIARFKSDNNVTTK